MLNSYVRATILKPVINEKSMKLAESSVYTFRVDRKVNKDQISQFVSKKFGVTVTAVRVINLPTKNKTQRNKRGTFEVAGIRKAVVTLKKGQKIALFEQAVAAPEEQEVAIRTAEGEVVGTTKEKKSILRGTKVKVEKGVAEKKEGTN